MSIGARREYLKAIWSRYRKAGKIEKTLILNELTQVTGMNRKYCTWRLGQPLARLQGPIKAGAPRKYDREDLTPFVRDLWMCMEQIGAKRMKAALIIWLPFYRNEDLTPDRRAALLSMSSSTLERILNQIRKTTKLKGFCTTNGGTYVLKNRIPIQTTDFNISKPGYLEGDTVSHCGDKGTGEFISTLTYTDIFSSWTELRATPNKSSSEIKLATKDVELSLPFLVLSADYDNGSEFINYDMENYWINREKPVVFTRSRPYKKNDQCYVEQKNFTHVRQLFGYDRLTTRAIAMRMNQIYKFIWCPLHNYFLPSQKIIRKTRVGARIVKKYDAPKTPYQRLLESADLSTERKLALETTFQTLNPFELKLKLEQELKTFFSLVRDQRHPLTNAA